MGRLLLLAALLGAAGPDYTIELKVLSHDAQRPPGLRRGLGRRPEVRRAEALAWDDGTDLGSYNTQQHWVAHSEGLFLVYTRRGANNGHVMRHRAPLFIAQVDPVKLHVLRSTERELMPNRGARPATSRSPR